MAKESGAEDNVSKIPEVSSVVPNMGGEVKNRRNACQLSQFFSSSSREYNREMSGGMDLIKDFQLQELYEHYCKSPQPVSISDTSYLHDVVGDVEILRGEGMELGQLINIDPHNSSSCSSQLVDSQLLDQQVLKQAFMFKESGPRDLSSDPESFDITSAPSPEKPGL